MIKKFPLPKRPAAPPLAVLAVHSDETREEHELALAWVTWIFQGVRARCEAVFFHPLAEERAEVLAEWERFAHDEFLPKLAPWLLRGWTFAREGDDAALAEGDRTLGTGMRERLLRSSTTAGAILLEQTRGAKHQATLGRFRERVHRGECDAHLVSVWAALAALFQMPPVDVLAEYLRQEWLVATKHGPHHEAPCGPLSFEGLAHRALHEAGIMRVVE